MKRALILLAISLFLLSPMAYSATEISSTNAEVSWELVGCWAELNWTGGDNYAKYLGSINNYSDGTEIVSQSDHNLQARTNCRGYTVDVEAMAFDLPAGHLEVPETAVERFGLTIDDWTNYKFFTDGFNVEKNMVTSSNAGTTNFDILYKYTTSVSDVSGDYTVYLKYTMSTN